MAEDGTLTVDGKDVAVVYLRAGYSPDDYPTQQEWEGRFKLEISDAPKVRSALLMLGALSLSVPIRHELMECRSAHELWSQSET